MDNEKPVTRTEFDSGLQGLRTEIRAQKDELVNAMRQIETNLLTEFHRYAKGENARVHNVEVGESDLKLHLSVVETRLPPSAL